MVKWTILNSIYLNLNEEDRTYIKRTMISGAFYQIGMTKIYDWHYLAPSTHFKKFHAEEKSFSSGGNNYSQLF